MSDRDTRGPDTHGPDASDSGTGDWGSWDEDRERKYVLGLEASPDERLAWLEEMLELAHSSGALPKARDAWGQPIEPQPIEPQPIEPQPIEPQPIEPQPIEPQPIEPQPMDPGERG
ncbi:MAG: hypothetical protein M5U28_40990 [Sandaracinaceae bacterium]|nr:hypothetical protein [Sandaracinaceae bacterium]